MLLPKTPFSKANHFGISLGDNSVRLVSIDTNGAVLAQEQVISDQPIIKGDWVDQANISQALKQMIDQSGVDQKYAAICIPEKYAFSRAHTFPKVEPGEIDEAIDWQLEKIFPFAKNEVYYDWKLINQEKDQTTVLVTVIPKNLLDNLKNAIQSGGIFPISFEPSASALTRLVKSDQANQIIIELNTFFTSATLVVDNISSLTTTTSFESQTPPQQVLQQITDSINNLISYMHTHKISLDQTKLILTGEKASPQLAEIIGQNTHLPAKILTLDNIEPQFHLAYVAATAQILPPASDQSINLLPTSLQTYYQAQSNFTLAKSVLKYSIGLAVVSVLISALGFGLVQFMITNTAHQKTSIESQPVITSTSFDLAKVNRKANNIVQLFKLKTTPEQSIQEIITAIPQNIIISRFQVNAATKQFTLTGTAKDRQDLLQLKSNLEALNKFTKINIPLATLEIQKDINFEISFTSQPNQL